MEGHLERLVECVRVLDINGWLDQREIWNLQYLSNRFRGCLERYPIDLTKIGGERKYFFRPERDKLTLKWDVIGLCVEYIENDSHCSFSSIEEVASLNRLYLRYMFSASCLQGLGARCLCLRELHLTDIQDVGTEDFTNAFCGLGQLEKLFLADCHLLSSLEPLSCLVSLKHLELVQLNSLCDISCLPPCLEVLTLIGLDLCSFEPLECLPGLVSLKIIHCTGSLVDIVLSESVESILIGFMLGLSRLGKLLSRCHSMRSLSLISVGVINLVGAPRSLEEIVLKYNSKLVSLEGVSHCTKLQSVLLHHLVNLKDISPLLCCKGIEKVHVEHCEQIQNSS
mmetsp:Transcript_5029/g.7655  ORF Transcript_5029/g.7655 Transcript_5029/m.7655 type:complete len:339 (-) Transcript_5029:1338-2354(-)